MARATVFRPDPAQETRMRTLLFLSVGLILAIVSIQLPPKNYRRWSVVAFTLVWLSVSVWNLLIGLSHGYTLAQELPIHLLLFGIPAGLAWVLLRGHGS